MSLDPLAPLKALLRARIRKLMEIERAKALEAEKNATKETPSDEARHDEQPKKTA